MREGHNKNNNHRLHLKGRERWKIAIKLIIKLDSEWKNPFKLLQNAAYFPWPSDAARAILRGWRRKTAGTFVFLSRFIATLPRSKTIALVIAIIGTSLPLMSSWLRSDLAWQRRSYRRDRRPWADKAPLIWTPSSVPDVWCHTSKRLRV